MVQNYKRLKMACYTANISMSIVGNLSPLLFLTFRSLYGISYSLLGLLVLINFFTQLIIDLIFSFFSHKFNIQKVVKFTPVLTLVGFLIYAIWPFFFPQSVYMGLLIGTVIFSASSGFSEVLISPTIAAIPSDNPEREMSKLHSIYAWGVVGMIVFGTLFLLLCGSSSWQYLTLILALVPVLSLILYAGVEFPKLETPDRVSGVLALMKNSGLWLCVAGIFLGGAAECTMAQWCSGYLEQAMNIPKVWGDIFGVALFSVMLGLGRTLYSKYGRNIEKFLLLGAIGATACYLIAAVSGIPIIGLLACAMTGLCTSMLWPGSLIAASDRFPAGGVFIYAMMASGGDMGAAFGPQLVGVITDMVTASPRASELAMQLSLSPEQLGMKLGMLIGALFPFAAIFVFLRLKHNRKHYCPTEAESHITKT